MDTWGRLAEMIAQLFPEAKVGLLNPPATLEMIQAVESNIGLTLPNDLREAYQRFDGVDSKNRWDYSLAHVPCLLLPAYDWVTLDDMARLWKAERELEIPERESGLIFEPVGPTHSIRPTMFDRRWIPVGVWGCQNMLFVDMNPGPAGVAGQLISRSLPGRETQLVAHSFRDCIEAMLNAVDAGKLVPFPEGRWIDKATGQPAHSLPK